MSEELLTIDDIAALYKLDRKQVRDSVVKTPGFPAFAPGALWCFDRTLNSDAWKEQTCDNAS